VFNIRPKKIKIKFNDLKVRKMPLIHNNSLTKLIVPGKPVLLSIKKKKKSSKNRHVCVKTF